MNPTGLALDHEGIFSSPAATTARFTASRPMATRMQWVEGMGIATGIAFDTDRQSLRGRSQRHNFQDRPGSAKFSSSPRSSLGGRLSSRLQPGRRTLRPGPTTSSYRSRRSRISPPGEVSLFFRGLGRPQGLAFDRDGNLYVAASYAGRRGIVRITPDGRAEVVLSGSGLVGLALLPTRRAVLDHDKRALHARLERRGLASAAVGACACRTLSS